MLYRHTFECILSKDKLICYNSCFNVESHPRENIIILQNLYLFDLSSSTCFVIIKGKIIPKMKHKKIPKK